MKRALPRSSLALIPLLLALVAGDGTIAAAQETVKVGMPIPLSGAGASIGQRFQKAGELAIEDLNKAAAGKMKFEAVMLDSRCNPDGAQTAGKKLILESNVTFMVGELCSDATLALKELAGQHKVPLVVPDSSARDITEKGNSYTFRIIPNEIQQHIALARVAVNYFKQKKFVVVYEQTSSGIGAGKAFIDEAKKLGAALVSRNIAQYLETHLADKPKSYRPLVYCWRGGGRSGPSCDFCSRSHGHLHPSQPSVQCGTFTTEPPCCPLPSSRIPTRTARVRSTRRTLRHTTRRTLWCSCGPAYGASHQSRRSPPVRFRRLPGRRSLPPARRPDVRPPCGE